MLVDTGHGLIPDYYFVSPSQNEYVRALESSLLLHQFVDMYQNEIVHSTPEELMSLEWIGLLVWFLEEKDFSYTTVTTDLLKDMQKRADIDSSGIQTKNLISRCLKVSEIHDRWQLLDVKDYIALRLLQIAWGREYGVYRAYNEILVQHRPDIQYASKLLLKRLSPTGDSMLHK
jgi:hypothetical protein